MDYLGELSPTTGNAQRKTIMSTYKMTTIEATDTNPASHTITVDTEYTNPIAQIFGFAGNRAKACRDMIEAATVNGTAEDATFSGTAVTQFIDAWNELDDNDDKEALACMKAAMATASRKALGFGCKIANSKMVGTKLGAGKKSVKVSKSASVEAVEAFEAYCTDAQRAEMLKLIEGAVELYACSFGATLKSA